MREAADLSRLFCIGMLGIALSSPVTGGDDSPFDSGMAASPAQLRRLPAIDPSWSWHEPLEAAPSVDLPGAAPAAPEIGAPPTSSLPAELATELSSEVVEEVVEVEKPPPDPWEGSVELGLDGTEGNSKSFNLRGGVGAKRTLPNQVLSLDLDYHKGSRNRILSAHRLFFEWRQEWLWEHSPWSYYVHGTTEYDEFRAFDTRVALDTGLGYMLFERESTTLKGRAGGGVSREFGGPADDYVPELVFGLELEHKFSKRQKIAATADYIPDVTDFADYRVNLKAGWEALIDEEMNLSLKVGVRNQYDSTPNGVDPNDFDYSVVLLWKF